MQEIEAPPLASHDARPSRLDGIMSLVVWLLSLSVIVFIGWIGYTVWATNNTESLSTPAMRAIAAMKQEARRRPNDAAVRVRLGEALAAAGLVDEAAQQLGEAVKLNPKHDGAFMDLGLLTSQQKNWPQAEAYFKKVVDLTQNDQYTNVNPRREQALFYLGQVAYEQRHYEDAVSYYKGAVRIRRDAADSYFNMALAYKALKEYDAELKQLEVAVAYDSKYTQAWYEMGQVYEQRKDYVNASWNYKKAVDVGPDEDQPKEALAALGTAQEWRDKATAALAAGKLDEAVNDVLVARNLDPKDVQAAKLNAQLAERKGDKKTALSIYNEALKLDPKNADIKAAIKRLGGK